MFKGLRFWCGTASVFFRAASKQPLKPYLLKTVAALFYVNLILILVSIEEIHVL